MPPSPAPREPVPFAPSRERRFFTVREIVAAAPHLGLPHFQRGAVWRSSDVARLLESLALDTPCGTLLLWQPVGLAEAFSEHGVRAWSDVGVPEYLVLDGQQRITTLVTLLGPANEAALWAVNPSASPTLASGLEDVPRKLPGEGLFVRLERRPSPGDDSSGRRRAAWDRRRKVLAPLVDLLHGGDAQWPGAGRAPGQWRALVEGVRAIPDRELHVAVRRQRGEGGDERFDLGEAVALYNRINSSGRGVELEERAFAGVVAAYPAAGGWMAETFRLAHGKDESPSRDAWLTRERERQFGFKLFVRGLAAAFGVRSEGRSWSRNDLARADLFARLSAPLENEEIDGAFSDTFAEARQAILTTRRALDHLGCDELRLVPSERALRAVFPVLLLYPGITDEQAAAVVLLLQCFGDKARRELVAAVRDADTEAEALSAVLGALPSRDGLIDRLGAVTTLQSGMVSVLYLMLRAREARDLEAGGAVLSVREPVQRQHIVPYAQLRAAYGLSTRRPGSHDVHRIGNVTLLSGRLNYELGDRLDYLDGLGDPLLDPHCLGGSVGAAFDEVRRRIEADRSSAAIRAAFDEFCKARTEVVGDRMHAWLSGLSTCLASGQKGVAPSERRFDPITRQLRGAGLGERLTSALVRARRHGTPKEKFIRLAGRSSDPVRRQIRVRLDGSWLEVGPRSDAAERAMEVVAPLLGPPDSPRAGTYFAEHHPAEDFAAAVDALVDLLRPRR